MRGRDTPGSAASGEVRSSQLSAMLADMVRTEEVPVEGWSPDLRPGGAVGRFRIVRELGAGGFGIVYEARDEELDRAVALKVLRPGTRVASDRRPWLEREARAVARLNHPHIVTLHDFGRSEAGPYLVFELLAGTSLARRLEEGALPLDEALRVGLEVSRALVHAHDSGVVHRDLKPANVHLDADGAVKVLDFGLAHLFGEPRGAGGGTPAYMAPEQWGEGGATPRSDLFALGVILHQCLSGALPYRAERGWSEVTEPGPTPLLPRRAAPPAVRRLVAACLDRDPARRPADARAVRDALLAITRARAGRGRRRVLAALAAVTAAALGVAGWLLASREPPPGEQVRAVLAATENAAGEPALAPLDGLLRAALAPSRRVRLVAPARLERVAREAGFPAAPRLDAERARAVARVAGAAVVLVPAARRAGDGLAVEVRGVEAETGRTLFTAREHLARAADVVAAADALADAVRRALDERREDRRIRRPVAEAVTASAEAARLYYEGLDCVAPRSAFGDVMEARCAHFFERALAIDPAFPLAHFQLAALRTMADRSGDRARAALAAALRGVDRLPPREARLLRAHVARDEGRAGAALEALAAVLADDPEDRDALLAAGTIEFSRGAWEQAVPYLAKLAELAPDEEEPAFVLVEALGRGRDEAALRARVEAWTARPLTAARRKAMATAFLWLGEPAAAVEVSGRAVAGGARAEVELRFATLAAAGRYADAEAAAREAVRERADDPFGHVLVARALAARGRVREAARTMHAAAEDARLRHALAGGPHAMLAIVSAVRGDAREAWRQAQRASALTADRDGELAIVLAWLGDGAGAARLAESLPPGSAARSEYDAVRRWRAGDAAGAVAALLALEARDPLPVALPPPAFLVAEIAVAEGDAPAALAALERFRHLPPRGNIHLWTYPRSLYLAAAAHHAAGDRASAARALDALAALLAGADPDLPILRHARELRGRL